MKANLVGWLASEKNRRISCAREARWRLPKTLKRGDIVKSRLPLTSFYIVMVLGLMGRSPGQTYDVGGGSN